MPCRHLPSCIGLERKRAKEFRQRWLRWPEQREIVGFFANVLRAYAEEARREDREAWLNRAAEIEGHGCIGEVNDGPVGCPEHQVRRGEGGGGMNDPIICDECMRSTSGRCSEHVMLPGPPQPQRKKNGLRMSATDLAAATRRDPLVSAKAQTETQIVRAILDYLAANRIIAWRQNTGAARNPAGRLVRFGVVGMPDVLGLLPGGRLLAIEVKRPGRLPSRRQDEMLQRLQAAGALAACVTSIGDLENNLIAAGYRVLHA